MLKFFYYLKYKKVIDLLLDSFLFDYEWYKSKYNVNKSKKDAFIDFCINEWKLGRSPSKNFDVNLYLKDKKFIYLEGINPLFHFFLQDKSSNEYLIGSGSKQLNINSNNRKCIYTICIGNDNFCGFNVYDPTFDYICITDNEELLAVKYFKNWKFLKAIKKDCANKELIKYNINYIWKYDTCVYVSPNLVVNNSSFYKKILYYIYFKKNVQLLNNTNADCIVFNNNKNTRKIMSLLYNGEKIELFVDDNYDRLSYFEVLDSNQFIKKIDGMQYLDRKSFDKNNLQNTNKGKVIENLIVSFTTIPSRLKDAEYVICSILTNSYLPSKIVLYVSDEDFPNRNELDFLYKYIKDNLVIKWVKNIRSYKKLIPALSEFKDFTIITIDDDIYYYKDFIKNLYDEYENYNGKCIICSRGHLISCDEGNIRKYTKWKRNTKIPYATNSLVPTGCGGVLYPPNVFYDDILNDDIFMNIAPSCDDLWFWAMSTLKNIPKKVIKQEFQMIHVDLATELGRNDKPSLMKINYVNGSNNDTQLFNIVSRYPSLLNMLDEHIRPFISIIVPVFNAEMYLERCITSLQSQELENIEMIFINDCSTDKSLDILKKYQKQDSRIRILNNAINSGCNISRNKAIKESKGIYIGFVDSDDAVPTNYFKVLYECAKEKECEIVATPKADWIDGDNIKKKNLGIREADFWCYDLAKIAITTGTVWNKIYCRDFLINNKIEFCEIPGVIGGDNKFTFGCMINLEKIYVTTKTKYLYFKNNESITNKKKNKNNLNVFELYSEIKLFIDKTLIPKRRKLIWHNNLERRITRDLTNYLKEVDTDSLKKSFIKKAKEKFPNIELS